MRHDHDSDHAGRPLRRAIATPIMSLLPMRRTRDLGPPFQFTVPFRHVPSILRKGLRQAFDHGDGTVLPARAPEADREMRLPLLQIGRQQAPDHLHESREERAVARVLLDEARHLRSGDTALGYAPARPAPSYGDWMENPFGAVLNGY